MTNWQDALKGVEFGSELVDGLQVVDAMILVRTVDMETGEESWGMDATTGMSGLVQLGILEAARFRVRLEAGGIPDPD